MSKRATFKALVESRLDDLAQLLKSGVDVDSVADFDVSLVDSTHIAEGDTLLHVALHTGNREAIELLLRFGANLNVSAADGVTPLQIAVNKGLNDLALWLLDSRVNFNTADRYGLTPLHYTQSSEIIQFILNKGVSVDLKAHSTVYTPLHYSAYHNCVKKCDCFWRGADPMARGNDGETPLHLLMALKYRDVSECAKVLLDAGCDINASDNEGNTPLHWALGAHEKAHWMHRGNPQAVSCLLDHEADFRIKNFNGLTAVEMAWRCDGSEYRKPFEERFVRPAFWDRIQMMLS